MLKGVKTKKPKKAKAVKKTAVTRKAIKLKVKKEEDIVAQIKKVEKVERDKRLILWSGVTFFMIVIFVFWIYTLKQTFVKVETENNSQEFIWSDIADNFSKTIGEVKENIAEIKELTKTDGISTTTEENISTSTDELPLDVEEIEELKKRLKELEDKLGTSSPENFSRP